MISKQKGIVLKTVLVFSWPLLKFKMKICKWIPVLI